MSAVGHRTARWLARFWPVVLSIVASVCILAVAGFMALELREASWARARDNAENLVGVIERDLEQNIEVLSLSLQAVVDNVNRSEVQALSPEMQKLVLFDRAATARNFGALVVFDAKGQIAIDSQSGPPRMIEPVTDREYFQALKREDTGLFISRPYRSRLLGEPVVGLSRRITAPDGSFAGIAHATLQIRSFRELLSRVQLGHQAVATLVRDDGAIIIRHSNSAFETSVDVLKSDALNQLRANGEAGCLISTSQIDGVERLYTFRRVGKTPLIFIIGLSTSEILAGWLHRTLAIGSILVGICMCAITLTVLLTRQLALREAAEQALTASNARLAELAVTDALTGLPNRRAFDLGFERDARRANRAERPLSLVLVDVDHFKLFNDRYGHPEGDAVLVQIGTILTASAKEAGGSAYRLGGEEFGILLPNRRLAIARLVGEAVRAGLRSWGRAHADSPIGIVSASMGAVEVGAETTEEAFARCDRALYRAKSTGRDRVVTELGRSSDLQASA